MNIFKLIFGDRYAERIGRSLLNYFDSEDFPEELLMDETLDNLYYSAQCRKIDTDKTLKPLEAVDRMLSNAKAHFTRQEKRDQLRQSAGK